jgi:hypothetical protein
MTCIEEVLYAEVLDHIKERAMVLREPALTSLISGYERAIQKRHDIIFSY